MILFSAAISTFFCRVQCKCAL